MKMPAALALLILALPSAGIAQTQKPPLEISADGTLEWNRNAKTFTATKNALAAQGDVSIAAETLTAAYDENSTTGKNFDLKTMIAETDVILTSQENKAYGDKAVYDLKTKLAIMTGTDLRLIMPEQTITARDRFEYHVEAGKLLVIGDAKIIRASDTLQAATLTAYLTNDAQGKRSLDRMEASGGVVITTPTEKLTGTYGTYNARTNTAEVTGNVTITRGPNILKGQRATVDLNTQISKLFGGNTETGRVTGTFYPESTNK